MTSATPCNQTFRFLGNQKTYEPRATTTSHHHEPNLDEEMKLVIPNSAHGTDGDLRRNSTVSLEWVPQLANQRLSANFLIRPDYAHV